MLNLPAKKIIRRYPPTLLLYDSCILQNLCGKMRSGIEPFLTEIQSQTSPRISDYTVYELLRGANKKTEQEMRGVLNKITRFGVSTKVLVLSSLLYTLYQEERVDSGISDGDKILAATSILTQAPIMTQNGRHFPRPFFDEMEINFCRKTIIEYGSKQRQRDTSIVYFLEPDYSVINEKITKRK